MLQNRLQNGVIMDQKISKVLNDILTIDLIQMVLSNSSKKDLCAKIKIRPILIKEELRYQSSKFCGTKVFHENLTREQVVSVVEEATTTGDITFGQIAIETKAETITILISKKGTVTVKRKAKKTVAKEVNLSHNRKKQYILEEGQAVPFLVDLGVMTEEGKVVKAKYDKYRQINRFLEFVEDILPSLPKDEKVTILDFGCGKSYLTFAMYYYLKVLKKYDIQIIGLDLKEDVIKTCNGLAKKYGYEELQFLIGDIASYEGVNKVDMVVTLHACDTATDYALYKAIRWGAKVILSVPCCQHELNAQMENTPLELLFKYGLIKERSAALFTDAIRANLLEQWGYRTQILEFIDMSHTPKNILIRAVKNEGESKQTYKKITRKGQSQLDFDQLLGFFNIHPTLEKLLKEYETSRKDI